MYFFAISKVDDFEHMIKPLNIYLDQSRGYRINIWSKCCLHEADFATRPPNNNAQVGGKNDMNRALGHLCAHIG